MSVIADRGVLARKESCRMPRMMIGMPCVNNVDLLIFFRLPRTFSEQTWVKQESWLCL
jgi:hypothetical protein